MLINDPGDADSLDSCDVMLNDQSSLDVPTLISTEDQIDHVQNNDGTVFEAFTDEDYVADSSAQAGRRQSSRAPKKSGNYEDFDIIDDEGNDLSGDESNDHINFTGVNYFNSVIFHPF